MRKICFFLFLTISGGALAQFHTVTCAKNIFKVETDSPLDSIPVCENYSKKESVDLAEDTLSSRLQEPSLNQSCLDRYLSVSLPLDDIQVSSRYGWRRNPFGRMSLERHNGLDLKAPANSKVFSMFAGQVVCVSSDARSGNYITLQHGDYLVSYCHLSQCVVSKGDVVMPGDMVAWSGSTGRSTGPHLHITCKRKGVYVDPTVLLEYILNVRTRALEELARNMN